MSLLDGGKQDAAPGSAGDEGLESYVSSGKPAAAKPSAPAPAGTGGGVFSGLRVSLMPSELEGKTQGDPGKRLLALALVLVVETAVILGAFYLVTRTISGRTGDRDQLLAEVDELSRSIAKEEAAAKDLVAYETQVAAATETLDKHVFWTSFFAFIEKKTIPSVKYLNFSGDADSGTVTLDAIGATYRDVAEQIVAFRDDERVVDARSSSASARVSEIGEITGVSFTLVLRLKPEVWKKTVTANGTAPSVQPSAAPAVVPPPPPDTTTPVVAPSAPPEPTSPAPAPIEPPTQPAPPLYPEGNP